MEVTMPFNIWNLTENRWQLFKSFHHRRSARDYLNEVVLKEEPDGKFEVRRVLSALEAHGTKVIQLKPSMIWKCAMDDLERRERNKTAAIGDCEAYAFHRAHVANAKTANDIIRAAIAGQHRGLESGKKDTRLLYSSRELLEAALQ
jgi:hypothetical protein